MRISDWSSDVCSSDLQQRLNRKTVTPKQLREQPAFVRLYDILFEGTEDPRPLPFDARRRRPEAWYAKMRPANLDLSPLVAFETLADLHPMRARTAEHSVGKEWGVRGSERVWSVY